MCGRRASPQIAVVMGSCTAGGAYVPAMSDETIIVKNQGTIFLGGPPLVKAATGEVVSAEELGGGDVHTRLSGVADHLADERRARAGDRAPHRRQPEPQQAARRSTREPREEPLLRPGGALRHHPAATRASPTTCARSSRASSTARAFDEFKARYGTTLVTGFAHLYGMPVGIVANNGILFSRVGAEGRALHRALLRSARMPLLFLQNITGFMVGTQVRDRRHRQATAPRW